jgi:glycosyltransferase involved in cell wall biosynthesis
MHSSQHSKKILFVGHAPHAIKALEPIAYRLDKMGYSCRGLLFANRLNGTDCLALAESFSFGIDVYDESPWDNPESSKSILRHAAKLAPEMVTHWKMIRRARDIISPLKPKAVLFTDDHIFPEAYLVRAANELNIPTLLVQWAFTLPQKYYDQRRANKIKQVENNSNGPTSTFAGLASTTRSKVRRWLSQRLGVSFQFVHSFGGGESKHIAVSGEAFADQFAQQGVSPDRIIVTGSPEHDLLYDRKKDAKASEVKMRIRSDFGLDRGPLVVFSTQPLVHFGILSEKERKYQMSVLAESVLKRKDTSFIVTLHPREEIQEYHFLRKYGKRLSVCKGYDLIRLIDACDIYVSQFSSTILMAMAWGKPVMTFNFANIGSASYFAGLGGSLHVTKPEDLADAVYQLLTDRPLKQRLLNEQREIVHRYMKFDGKAIDRIIAIIESSHVLKPLQERVGQPGH